MKTSKNLIERVASFENLYLAYLKARRGKANSTEVQRFNFNLEPELFRLQRELLDGSYETGNYRNFTIFEPKKRLISALPFRDRVAHHAICAVIEPVFEKTFVSDSYACRIGRGSHRAIRRLKGFLAGCRWNECVRAGVGAKAAEREQEPFVLKCDVSKYFASVDHEKLKRVIRKKIGCRRLLRVLDDVIDSFSPGIPIGNLTSQFFANIYLTELDYFVKQRLRVKRYVRYMDDFILVGGSKNALQEAKNEIAEFLRSLGLSLHKTKATVFPARVGVDFLGYVVRESHVVPRRKTVTRFLGRMKVKLRSYFRGEILFSKLAESFNSWEAYLSHSRGFLLEKSIYASYFGNVM